MKTSFTRLLPAIAKSGWLPAVTKTPTRRTALAAVGLAAVCGGVAGPAAAMSGGVGTSGMTEAVASPKWKAPAAPARPTPVPANAPAGMQLNYQYQLQSNFYYCGPAATRIAVSVQGHTPSQDEVARQLGTTVNGTNSVVDTTRALNSIDGNHSYHATSISGRFATPFQAKQLQSDVVRAVSTGNPIVANIAGTATDTLGGMHSYEGGHYVTVVGYQDDGQKVLIADPADTVADGSYWMHTADVANWMATRGYSS